MKPWEVGVSKTLGANGVIMKKKNVKRYLVVYLSETDGDINIHTMSAMQILRLAKSTDQRDMAIIEGNLIKTFGSLIDTSKL